MGVLAEMWKDRQTHALPPAGRMPKQVRLDEFCDWIGIEEEEADGLSLDWLFGLDIFERRFTLDRARQRFAGSELADYEVLWEVGHVLPTDCFRKGELFGGHGPDLVRAALSGLMVAYELSWHRKQQVKREAEGS